MVVLLTVVVNRKNGIWMVERIADGCEHTYYKTEYLARMAAIQMQTKEQERGNTTKVRFIKK